MTSTLTTQFQRSVFCLVLASCPALAQVEPNTEFEIIPRPTDEQEFPAYIEYLVEVAEPRTPEEIAGDAELKRAFEDALVITTCVAPNQSSERMK